MPTRERVLAYIAAMEGGDHVAGVAEFYHEDASVRENQNPAHVGRDKLIAREREAQTKFKIITHPARRVLIDGDQVVVNWVFDIIDKSGVARRLDELSIQRWRGDRIADEQFYYDTRQLKR